VIRKTPLKRSSMPPRSAPMPRKRPGTRRRMDAEGRVAIPIAGKARLAHFARVAALGCIACLIDGYPGTPPELHHPRANAGMGQKAPDTDVLPLCHRHHRGTDHPRTPSIHLDRLAFIERYGSETELLARVRAMTGD
jgi:hypothetical protein